jgi:peptide/nickel transport system substrate-binding protein
MLAAVAATAAAVAASLATGAGAAGDAGGTVTIRATQDFTTFDALQDNRPLARELQRYMYDSLVALGKDASKPTFVPYLATSWTATPSSVTFKVRKDAKCQDGSPLTLDAIADTFRKFIATPKSTSAPARIFGDGPYSVSINKKQSTFTFRTGTPFRNLLYGVGGTLIVCQSGLDAFAQNSHALEEKTYGSGAYTLASAVHGDQVVLKKNPAWKWAPKGVNPADLPDTVIHKVVLNETTAANLLLTGGLDVGQISGADIDRLKSESSLTRKELRGTLVANLMFNMRPGKPFAGDANQKLREAVMTALDPKTFIDVAYAGYADASPTQIPPTGDCYDASLQKAVPTGGIDKAKQILQQAGYTLVNGKLAKDGKQLPKINMLTADDLRGGSEYFYQTINALGFDIDWNNVLSAGYGTQVLAGNFDLLLQRGSSDAIPLGAMVFYHGPSTSNFAAIGVGDPKDPILERYFRFALRSTGKESCRNYSQAMKRLIDQRYMKNLAFPRAEIFIRKGVDYYPGAPSYNTFYYIKKT